MVGEQSWAGGKVLTHNGSNTTWYASIWVAPAREFATLVATNFGGSGAEAACQEASVELIKSVEFVPRGRARNR
jgi:hypothetical protein